MATVVFSSSSGSTDRTFRGSFCFCASGQERLHRLDKLPIAAYISAKDFSVIIFFATCALAVSRSRLLSLVVSFCFSRNVNTADFSLSVVSLMTFLCSENFSNASSEALEAYSFLARKESFTSFRVACRKRISAMSSNFLPPSSPSPPPRASPSSSFSLGAIIVSKSAENDPKLILPSDDESSRLPCPQHALRNSNTLDNARFFLSHRLLRRPNELVSLLNATRTSFSKTQRSILLSFALSIAFCIFRSFSLAKFSNFAQSRCKLSCACNKIPSRSSNRFVVFSHSKIVRCNFIAIASSSRFFSKRTVEVVEHVPTSSSTSKSSSSSWSSSSWSKKISSSSSSSSSLNRVGFVTNAKGPMWSLFSSSSSSFSSRTTRRGRRQRSKDDFAEYIHAYLSQRAAL